MAAGAHLTALHFSLLEALPDGCEALFDAAGNDSFYATRDWFNLVIHHAIPDGSAPRFTVISDGALPVAIVPLLVLPDGPPTSLTTFYTCLYQPLIRSGIGSALMRRIGQAIGRRCRHSRIVLEALDPEWIGLAPLLAGCGDAGIMSQRFDHFGNWHEPVAGVSYESYLARRPGGLRETIRRKTTRAVRDAGVSFEIVQTPDRIDAGIAAFEDVYARSWKDPEPYPTFNAAFMRLTAARGRLRLGIVRKDGRPVAVQYWLVGNGIASVLKLAHDDTFKALSPGTILTARMIEHLLNRERITELDFGRGDDAYKALWATRRRQRIGVVLYNPLRLAGLAGFGRHLAGRVGRSVLARLQRG